MVLITTPAHVDRLEVAGPARTTAAGRLAIPVALKDGKTTVATLDLVLDGPAAETLHDALDGHLAIQGAGTPAPCPTRSRSALLDQDPQ